MNGSGVNDRLDRIEAIFYDSIKLLSRSWSAT